MGGFRFLAFPFFNMANLSFLWFRIDTFMLFLQLQSNPSMSMSVNKYKFTTFFRFCGYRLPFPESCFFQFVEGFFCLI